MKTENENTPAFATANDYAFQKGLTKREYFAIMALRGMLAQKDAHELTIDHTTCNAVKFADSLLKELEIKNNDQ